MSQWEDHVMQKDHLQHFVDLRRGDIDPEIFGAALAVEHIYTLIAHGGSEFGRPEWDTALQPNHIQAFLARAVETAQKTKRFEREWNDLQRIFSLAWKKPGKRVKLFFKKLLLVQKQIKKTW